MSDWQDPPDRDEVHTRPDRLPTVDATGGFSDEQPPSPDHGDQRLRAAGGGGIATRIPLSGGAPALDGHSTAVPQVDAERLRDMLGRHPAPDEVAVARALLAGPMAWASDPSRHRAFVVAEFGTWTTARAGGDSTSNPYGPDHPDQEPRTVWAAAFARAKAAEAKARQAAAPTPIARTVRFWDMGDGTTIGTVTLTAAGDLEYSNDIVRDMMLHRVTTIGPERAFLRYTNWSNGYTTSSEI